VSVLFPVFRAGAAERTAWQGSTSAVERASLPDFHAGVKSLCQSVIAHFQLTDASAVDGDDSFWNEAVLEDL
jgi:hypothetical protein